MPPGLETKVISNRFVMVSKREVSSLLELSGKPKDFVERLENILKSNSRKDKDGIKKFIPGVGKTFNTPVPVLKTLGTGIGKAGEKEPKKYLNLLKRIWKSGYREGKVLSAFALERIGKKEPEASLKLVESFIPGIKNWEVCDQLATKGLRPLAVSNPGKILKLGVKCAKSRNKWTRRFGAVSLVPFVHGGNSEITQNFFDVLEPLMEDSESDVKKAVSWALRELTRKNPELVFRFLLKWTKKEDRNTLWIIKNGMKKLEKSKQDKILRMSG